MKKSYIHITLFVAVCLSLTACSLKNSQSANENIPQNSADAIDAQKEEETDELKERLQLYKAFLQDEISSENKEEKEAYYLRDYCNCVVPEEDKDRIQYALFDMTGNGLPELHVLTDISYSIHIIENNQLIEWYRGDRYNRPLNNRAILQKLETTGTHYSYTILDCNGKEVFSVGFSKPPKGFEKDYAYLFFVGDDEVELSEKKWDKLTKPFLSIGSDKIIWKNIENLNLSMEAKEWKK